MQELRCCLGGSPVESLFGVRNCFRCRWGLSWDTAGQRARTPVDSFLGGYDDPCRSARGLLSDAGAASRQELAVAETVTRPADGRRHQAIFTIGRDS